MQIDGFTFIAQIINFLILLMLLKRFLYKPVVEAMDRREAEIAGRIVEANRMMTEADGKEAEYEKKLRDFELKKVEMTEKARVEVESKTDVMLTEARDEVEKLQLRWKEALEGEREAFLRELQMETGEKIIDIIQEILTDLSNRSLEEQVSEIFMHQLEEMSKDDNRRLIKSALDYGVGIINVRSSFTMNETQKDQISEILREKVAPNVECKFEKVPSLGFGIELRAGGWRVGWNLTGYLSKLRERMEQFYVQKTYSNGDASLNGKGTDAESDTAQSTTRVDEKEG